MTTIWILIALAGSPDAKQIAFFGSKAACWQATDIVVAAGSYQPKQLDCVPQDVYS